MKTRISAARLGALLAVAMLVSAPMALGASVAPTLVDGNPTCSGLNSGWVDFKPVDNNPRNGSYSDGTLDVTISNDSANGFDWSASQGVDAVIVKAGTGANVYYYNPESTGDTGLTTPDKQDISHVDFCYDTGDDGSPPPPTCAEQNAGSPDSDGDGVVDACDNCPSVANADQMDSNGNGVGDACDSSDTPPGGGGDNPPGGDTTQPSSGDAPAADNGQAPADNPGAQAVLGERIASGAARLFAASGCVSKPFTARVVGTRVASVTFMLDGKRIVTLRNPNRRGVFGLRINPARYRIGVHRVAAVIRFTSASHTATRTLRASFQRCANRMVAPRFTG